jgi:hypothetical protein
VRQGETMSIDDQINGLKSGNFGGGGTFKISDEAAQQYYNAISYYRDALNGVKNSVQGKLIAPWGNVGSLGSANHVKSILAHDQPQALIDSIDKYLSYLDEFEDAIKAAYKHVHAVDVSFAPPPPAQPLPPLAGTEQLLLGPLYSQYDQYTSDLPIPKANDPLSGLIPTG